MAVVVVTTSNWNSDTFWSSVDLTGGGHTIDFSALDSSFQVLVDQSSGVIRISDGSTIYTVGEAGVAGTDANLGGTTQFDQFATISGSQGTDSIEASAASDTIYGNDGADRISGGDGEDELYGGAGNDEFDGGDGDDFITGNAGADQIYGGAGNDHLEGGWEDSSVDTVFGGAGDDLIFGYDGADLLFGGIGNDWIDGGAGDDSIEGADGDDRIVGDLGNDTISGGAGYDILTGGEGADLIDGGDDADQIWGNAGDTIFGGEGGDDFDVLHVSYVDSITYTTAESGTITFNSGETLSFSGIEQIVELTPDGTVDGTAGDDEIGQFFIDADGEWVDNGDAIGEGDGDIIRAGDGNDTIWSQDGDDIVHGEAGDDRIDLGGGTNVAFGGSGSDTIFGGWENDTISGDDYVATGPNLIVNGSFEDTTGMTAAPWGFSGTGGIAPGWTDANGNQIEFVNTGRDGLNATEGANWLDMEASIGQNMVASQTVAGIEDGQVYVLSFDVADFTNGDDGTTLDNQVQVLWNGEPVATIDPQDGSWTTFEFYLIGGSGDGSNTLTFVGSGNADNQGASIDNVQMYATTEAAGGDDLIYGGDGNEDLMGGAGNDTIDAGNGDDMVVAGSGADSVLGGSGNDTIWGGTGNDLDDAGGVRTTVVSEEDFTTAPTGWYDTATGEAVKTTAVLNDGNAFLGNFAGNGTGAEQVSKTFTLIEGADSAVIEFDFLKLDSWDENSGAPGNNERFIVYINGVAVFEFTPDGGGSGFGDGADASGSFAGGTWSVTSSGSDTEMFGSTAAGWGERAYSVQIKLDNPGDTVTLGIGTTLNQAASDESWGIDNVRVEATGALPADGADTIDAGAGDDLVYGGAGDDSILGGDGWDTIYGGDGNDSIHAGHQADLVYGGAGDDTINVGGGFDTAYGEVGDDLLIDDSNSTHATTLYGGDGNDTILSGVDGATGAAEYYGGAGDDRFEDRGGTNQSYQGGAGDDTYVALSGIDNDTVIGGEDPGDTDFDVIDLSALDTGVNVTFTGDEAGTISDGTDTLTFSEIEQIILTDLADVVDATGDPNGLVIDGGGGDDTITGSAGQDTISGGADADTFIVTDGFGDDTIIGGDTVTTGQNHDTIDLSAVTNPVSVVFTGPGAGTITDTVTGDVITFSGIESLILTGLDDVVDATLDDGTTSIQAGAGNDTITGGDVGTGGGYSHQLFGDSGDDVITSGAGDDWIEGGAGNDTIVLGGGADVVQGQGGADTFVVTGGFGGTHIDAGDDYDLIDLNGLPNPVQVVFTGPGAGTITDMVTGDVMTFENVSHIITTEHDDIIDATLDDGSTFVETRSGNDTLIGADGGGVYDDYAFDPNGEGNDTFVGGTGDDVFWLGTDDDLAYGGAGNDELYGQEGKDTLLGGDGNDTINGGFDADSISGDAGDDLIYGDYDAGGLAVSGGDVATGSTGQDWFTFDGATGSAATITLDDGSGTASDGDTVRDVIFVADTGDGADLRVEGFDYGVDWIATAEQWTSSTVTEVAPGNHIVTLTYADGSTQTFDVFHGNGSDFVVEDAFAVHGGEDTISGGAGNDVIYGGAGNDALLGDDGADEIRGGAGDDEIYAGADNDSVLGGTGNDLILGGLGDDNLNGEAGDDVIFGEGGNDTIIGFEGSDSVYGGDGDDVINTRTSPGTGLPDEGYGSSGNPLFYPGDPDALNDNDFVDAGAGNDSILTGDDDDIIFGGDGNDRVDAGFDDDQVSGGAGNDTLEGNEGNDVISGDEGDDVIYGDVSPDNPDYPFFVPYDLPNDGSDLAPNNNADTLYGGAGNDTMYGQDDNDTLEGGIGDDQLYGGNDDDVLDGGDGADSLFGGAGNDTLLGGNDLSADYLEGGAGDDDLSGGDGADLLYGGDGADTLFGGGDDDYLVGGAGADTLDGWTGNDTLIGGTGDDVLTGGDGDDIFVYNSGDGLVTITDFNFGNTGTLNDGDVNNNDFVDLSQFYDHLSELYADFNDDGILNQSNDGVGGADYSDNASFGTGGIIFLGATGDQTSFTSENTGVVCFAEGTLVLTEDGERPIETLQPGDRIVTLDNGVQPLVWVGRRHVGKAELAERPNVRPVFLSPKLTGSRAPLVVSPQHGVLFDLDGEERLVRATHLARLKGGGARVMNGCREVTYFHILFERHQIILANGVPSESFYPGTLALGAIEPEARQEISDLFPQLFLRCSGKAYGQPARRYLRFRELPDHLRCFRPIAPPPRDIAIPMSSPAGGAGEAAPSVA